MRLIIEFICILIFLKLLNIEIIYNLYVVYIENEIEILFWYFKNFFTFGKNNVVELWSVWLLKNVV